MKKIFFFGETAPRGLCFYLEKFYFVILCVCRRRNLYKHNHTPTLPSHRERERPIKFIYRERKEKIGMRERYRDLEGVEERGKRGNIEIYNKSFLTSDTRVRKRERNGWGDIR